MNTNPRDLIFVVLSLALAVGVGLLFAKMGEPSAVWLYCDMAGLC